MTRAAIVFAAVGLVPGVVLLALGVISIIDDQRQWETFARDHHCTRAGVAGGNIAARSSSGTPVTVGWACDDGVVYWRPAVTDF